jgi:hypothetical protein
VQVIDIGVNGIAPAPEGTYSSTIICCANGQHASRLLDRFHILEGAILQSRNTFFSFRLNPNPKGEFKFSNPPKYLSRAGTTFAH